MDNQTIKPEGPRLLMIEDDAILTSIYRSRFEREGYQVEVCTDGQAGFYRLHEVQFSVALLDLMLPQMNGLDILRKIRAQKRFERLPVIILTNTHLGQLVNEALRVGASQVFFKSTATPAQLVQAVNACLQASPDMLTTLGPGPSSLQLSGGNPPFAHGTSHASHSALPGAGTSGWLLNNTAPQPNNHALARAGSLPQETGITFAQVLTHPNHHAATPQPQVEWNASSAPGGFIPNEPAWPPAGEPPAISQAPSLEPAPDESIWPVAPLVRRTSIATETAFLRRVLPPDRPNATVTSRSVPAPSLNDRASNTIGAAVQKFEASRNNPMLSDTMTPEELAMFWVTANKRVAELRRWLKSLSTTKEINETMARLKQMIGLAHLLASSSSVAGLRALPRVAEAFEALLWELYNNPNNITMSTLTTVAKTTDYIGTLASSRLEIPEGLTPRILVVDDDMFSRRAMVKAMEKVNFKPVVEDSPEKALVRLESESFDLVITDVNMPGMTGFELCKKLRSLSHHKTTPVIFVTMQDDFKKRAESVLSGGNDLICKPYILIELALKSLVYVIKKHATEI